MSAPSVAAPVAPATPAVVTDRTRALRVLGGVGAASGVLFAGMSLWQQAAGLPDSGGIGNAINQGLFALASAGYVALAVGLHLARPGGSGRIARVFPALLGAAWLLILVQGLLEQLTSTDTEVLASIGGFAQVVAVIGLGITAATAGRWSGWRRYWPLAFAVYLVGGFMVPTFAGVEPGAIAVSLWALGYSGLGVALMTEQSARRIRGPVLIAALLVAVGAVVTVAFTTSPPAAIPQPPISVVQNPHGIGATTPGDGGPGYGDPSVGGSSPQGPMSTYDQTRGGTVDQGPLSSQTPGGTRLQGPISSWDQTLGLGPSTAPAN